MIGGAQGTGVDSSANAFGYAVASAGYNVFGKREYYSNIKGEHSYFNVVASETPVRSAVDFVHLLATFDAETVFRHAGEVVPGGGIIYDKSQEGERLKNIHTIERRVASEIRSELEDDGLGDTVKDFLKIAEQRGVNLYPIPYMDLLKKIGEEIGQTQLSVLTRLVNLMAVAASFALMRLDLEYLSKGISYVFRAKKKVVDMNVVASRVVMDYVNDTFGETFKFTLRPLSNNEERIFIDGSRLVGVAKIVAGCRFQTYYPITPAADESLFLEDKQTFEIEHEHELDYPPIAESQNLSKGGHIVVLQTEDEIAAIDAAIGASLAGARSSTATSGPGFSLMAEGLGWAGMNEVPVVVTLYQRGGPSTGLPTRHEQGDLLFSIFAGHGEFPRIVLASGDMEEAFYDTIKAFNYAERFQLPVIHLLDKSIANSTQTLKIPSLDRVVIDRGSWADEEYISRGYKRFSFTDDGISPRVALGTKGGVFWNTGDEHDEAGHISEEPVNRTKMMEKRMRKLNVADETIPPDEKVSIYGDESSDTWIISWGSTKGPILDAMELLAEDGVRLAFLQVRLLHPFPSGLVAEALRGAKRVIGLEQNYSCQLGRLLTMWTGMTLTNEIVKYNGRPFMSTEVRDCVMEVLKHNVKRVVTNKGR